MRHADSRGSLISTDSGNSLSEKNNDKGNSLDKVQLQDARKIMSYNHYEKSKLGFPRGILEVPFLWQKYLRKSPLVNLYH